MKRSPDPAARWVKQASPDDDYLPSREPRPFADLGGGWVADPGKGVAGLTVAEERALKDRIGLDGRIATALGRLTPAEFQAAKKAGKITRHGTLAAPKLPSTQRSTRTRTGRRPSRVTGTFTLEEYVETEERRRRAEAEAERIRRERAATSSERPAPSGRGVRFGRRETWITPIAGRGRGEMPVFVTMTDGPPPTAPDPYRMDATWWAFVDDDELPGEAPALVERDAWALAAQEEDRVGGPDGDFDVPLDWWLTDVDDRLPYQVEAEEDEHRAELCRLKRRLAEAEEAAVLAGWRSEIAERQATGDERFAADPTCGNPNGCTNKPKPRGDRCSACYEYRRKNGGAERPVRLVNRAKRRRAS